MDDRVEDAGHGIGARALELALAEQGVQLPDAIVEKAGPRVEDLLGQAAEERVEQMRSALQKIRFWSSPEHDEATEGDTVAKMWHAAREALRE